MWMLLRIVVIAVVLAVVTALVTFTMWRRRTRRRLLDGPPLIQTARGPIDCAVAGPVDAEPVLVLHGGVGGRDQGSALAEDLELPASYRVVAPSRPGYLRTPLQAGQTVDEAADTLSALLDALGIARLPVIGISGGGPTALALATRHPQRVRALIMLCAVSHRHVQPDITTDSAFGRLLFSSAGGWLLDLGCWLTLQLARRAPGFMAHRILAMTALGDRRSIRQHARALCARPGQLRWVHRLLAHSFPVSPRRLGLHNDLQQFAALPDALAARLACPVLVVHGRLDGNVPVAHAEAVIGAADQVDALIIEDASHLLWLHPRIHEVRDRLLTFLASTAH